MDWIRYEKDPINGCFYKVNEKTLFVKEIQVKKNKWDFKICFAITVLFFAVELVILGSL